MVPFFFKECHQLKETLKSWTALSTEYKGNKRHRDGRVVGVGI